MNVYENLFLSSDGIKDYFSLQHLYLLIGMSWCWSTIPTNCERNCLKNIANSFVISKYEVKHYLKVRLLSKIGKA